MFHMNIYLIMQYMFHFLFSSKFLFFTKHLSVVTHVDRQITIPAENSQTMTRLFQAKKFWGTTSDVSTWWDDSSDEGKANGWYMSYTTDDRRGWNLMTNVELILYFWLYIS